MLPSIHNNNEKRHIPVDLLAYMIEKRMIRTFQTYLVLNFDCSGYIDKSKVTNHLISVLAVSRQTIQRHLSKCVELNWLGYDKKRKIYYIRSIDYIRKITGRTKRYSVILWRNNITELKSFAYASIITKLITELRRHNAAQLKGSANQRKVSSYVSVSQSFIGQKYKISQSQCAKLQTKSTKDKFISVKHNSKKILDENGTPIKLNHKNRSLFERYRRINSKFNASATAFRIKNSEVYEIHPNSYISHLSKAKRKRV